MWRESAGPIDGSACGPGSGRSGLSHAIGKLHRRSHRGGRPDTPSDKGTPAVRPVRKAAGLSLGEMAGLPKKGEPADAGKPVVEGDNP
jgi:hypothetical protein